MLEVGKIYAVEGQPDCTVKVTDRHGKVEDRIKTAIRMVLDFAEENHAAKEETASMLYGVLFEKMALTEVNLNEEG